MATHSLMTKMIMSVKLDSETIHNVASSTLVTQGARLQEIVACARNHIGGRGI